MGVLEAANLVGRDRHGFSQREKDSESSLMHFRARCYDPRIGRFTQRDPIVGNRPYKHYIYASNNPLSRIDPLGDDDHHIFSKFRDAAPKYADYFKKVFGSNFDVDAFTVDIPGPRHSQMSPTITKRWKDFIDEVEDLGGTGKIGKRKLQGMTLAKMQEIAEEFKYDNLLDKVKPYRAGAAGDSLDDLLKHGRNAGINLSKSRKWLSLVKSAVKKGSRVGGAVMAAWAVANFASDPKAAIAAELGVSVQSVEDLFEGRMDIKFSIGKPGTSVSHAVLMDGSIIFKGQELVRNRWNDDLRKWEIFDITVKDIRTTETWGKYHLFWGDNEKEAFIISGISGSGTSD